MRVILCAVVILLVGAAAAVATHEQGVLGAECPNQCSFHGRCVHGKCYCTVGFSGDDCATQECPNFCSGQGLCLEGKCLCDPGFEGEDCRFTVALPTALPVSVETEAEPTTTSKCAKEAKKDVPTPVHVVEVAEDIELRLDATREEFAEVGGVERLTEEIALVADVPVEQVHVVNVRFGSVYLTVHFDTKAAADSFGVWYNRDVVEPSDDLKATLAGFPPVAVKNLPKPTVQELAVANATLAANTTALAGNATSNNATLAAAGNATAANTTAAAVAVVVGTNEAGEAEQTAVAANGTATVVSTNAAGETTTDVKQPDGRVTTTTVDADGAVTSTAAKSAEEAAKDEAVAAEVAKAHELEAAQQEKEEASEGVHFVTKNADGQWEYDLVDADAAEVLARSGRKYATEKDVLDVIHRVQEAAEYAEVKEQ